jgi:NADH-quinone oxidoreductase subunit J
VLFLFVIMLLNLQPEALARMRVFTLRTVGTAAAAVWCVLMWRLFVSTHPGTPISQHPAPAGLVEPIGRELFTRYLLPFEFVSFIILAAIIGAVTLGKQERPST